MPPDPTTVMPELTLAQYEQIMPVIEGHGAKWYVPNQHCAWRVVSLEEKEPDTLEWIAGFKEGDILWDVGANVGMYSIIAGMKGHRVYAFEPEAQNYAILQRNIFLNELQDRVTAYPLAISSAEHLDELYLSGPLAGGSCHTFGEAVNFKLEAKDRPLHQGAMSTSLSELWWRHGLAIPQHIKVDVDGLEHEVVYGMQTMLEKGELRSVLLELNTNLDVHRALIGQMEAHGFETTIHPQAIRTEGAFKGVGNHIFRKVWWHSPAPNHLGRKINIAGSIAPGPNT